MAYNGKFCTLLEFQYKCGANASATSTAEAFANSFVGQAESYINAATHYNWSDTFSTLNADAKGILTEAASSLAAIYAISYDMSGFTSRQEALIMINILWARVDECIKILIKDTEKTFVQEA
jgi:hypothetical protein